MLKKKAYFTLLILLITTLLFTACAKSEEIAENKSNNVKEEEKIEKNSDRPDGVEKDYPNKDIEYIYGFSPGSAEDSYIKLLFDKVKENEGWEHSFVIKYQQEDNGKLAWENLAKAKADGYTLGFVPSDLTIKSIVEEGQNDFDYNSFDYLFNMMNDPGAIGVAIDSKYNTLEELVADAKEKPEEITIALTSDIGSEDMAVKLIERASGAKFNIEVFEENADLMKALMDGSVDAFCLNVTDTKKFIDDDQVKVLATGDRQRSEYLPDMATYKESGFDIVQLNMKTIAGPKGLDEELKKYLIDCLKKAAEDPEIKAKAEEMEISSNPLSGNELKERFDEIYNEQLELWQKSPWK